MLEDADKTNKTDESKSNVTPRMLEMTKAVLGGNCFKAKAFSFERKMLLISY